MGVITRSNWRLETRESCEDERNFRTYTVQVQWAQLKVTSNEADTSHAHIRSSMNHSVRGLWYVVLIRCMSSSATNACAYVQRVLTLEHSFLGATATCVPCQSVQKITSRTTSRLHSAMYK